MKLSRFCTISLLIHKQTNHCLAFTWRLIIYSFRCKKCSQIIIRNTPPHTLILKVIISSLRHNLYNMQKTSCFRKQYYIASTYLNSMNIPSKLIFYTAKDALSRNILNSCLKNSIYTSKVGPLCFELCPCAKIGDSNIANNNNFYRGARLQ